MAGPKTGIYSEAMIRALLQQDEEFLYKALLLLFERQTQDEQSALVTKHRNRVGFTAADGTAMGQYAEIVKLNGKLSDKNRDDCRRRMLKYAKQLHSIGEHLLP